jgi:hypothetical protein
LPFYFRAPLERLLLHLKRVLEHKDDNNMSAGQDIYLIKEHKKGKKNLSPGQEI